MKMTELSAEDQKLITLAKGARARIGAPSATCVRDTDGRTYSAATVEFSGKKFDSAELAIATALSAGAKMFEAVCVLGDEELDLSQIKSILLETGIVITCDAQGEVLAVIS
ncbi:MAG: hypothetical protein RL228_1165 [Actinomycetota bacterium]